MASIRCLAEKHGERFAVYNADCVDLLAQIPAQSVGFTIYSPPFSNLFVYSDNIADMGNVYNDEEFFTQYQFLCRELVRVTKPGRLIGVHCSDLPYMKWRDGMIGIKDISGGLIRAHEQAGCVLHSRVTVWKSPVVEMQRTKALGLLYKQLRADSSKSRTGMPDYLLVFRVPGENAEPIEHTEAQFSLDTWQEWASPVWMTINQTNTLNSQGARTDNDERHIAPLQLDLIERAITLWSNPNDIILSPFMGIGSEGYVALKLKRRFLGIELKDSYFKLAVKYLTDRAAGSGFFERMTAA